MRICWGFFTEAGKEFYYSSVRVSFKVIVYVVIIGGYVCYVFFNFIKYNLGLVIGLKRWLVCF